MNYKKGTWHLWKPKSAMGTGPVPYYWDGEVWKMDERAVMGTATEDMEYNNEYAGRCSNS